MTDRELLERAARAAGYTVRGWIGERIQLFDPITEWAGFEWNPLTSDADAFRLAVDLGIDIVRCHTGRIIAYQGVNAYVESSREDKHAATRRAITRAAAAMA